jgi:hypothetical protein
MDFNLIWSLTTVYVGRLKSERGEFPTFTRKLNKLQQYCFWAHNLLEHNSGVST